MIMNREPSQVSRSLGKLLGARQGVAEQVIPLVGDFHTLIRVRKLTRRCVDGLVWTMHTLLSGATNSVQRGDNGVHLALPTPYPRRSTRRRLRSPDARPGVD